MLLLGFFAVLTATFVWTSQLPVLYETTTTYIIRPRESSITDDKFVQALDIVSRRVEINTTFAEVATSKLIRSKAVEALNLSPEQTKDLAVSGYVVGGTNILNLSVQGRDPVVIRDFANMVGAETVNYIGGLYDVYELQVLDEANVPTKPVSPNTSLNLLLGSFVGLALGIGLAFLIEYIKAPFVEVDTFNIVDRETGAYNKSYLTLRMWQEMSRAKRNKYPLSLGLIRMELIGENFSNRDRTAAMRAVKILTERFIREDDVLACINGDTFAFLLPYMPSQKAKEFMESMKQRIGMAVSDIASMDGNSYLRSYASVVTYNGSFIKQEDLLKKAIRVLEDAGSAPGELVTLSE